MKTKKFFKGLFLLAIAGLWAGCTNDEVIEPLATNESVKEISFRVQGGMLRATGTQVGNVDAFVVNAYDDGATPTIFQNITVALDKTSGKYDYNPKKYYAKDATGALFYAFSPVTAPLAVTKGGADEAGLVFTYTNPVPTGTSVTSQVDLLVAGETVTGISPSLPSPQTVNFQFHHALSRIFVTATNTTKEKVIIKKLELLNLNSVGTLTYDATPAFSWGTLGTKLTHEYALAASGIAVQAGLKERTFVTSMEQGMMVIPQELTWAGAAPDSTAGNDFGLKITYDIANLTNQVACIYLPNGYKLDAGKQYAINIDFGGSVNLIEINFSISVDSWGSPISYVPKVVLSFDMNGLGGSKPDSIEEDYDETLPGADFAIPEATSTGATSTGTLEWNTKPDGTGITVAEGSNDIFSVNTTLYLFDRQSTP